MINLSDIDWTAFYKGLEELQKTIPQPTPAAALTKTEESTFGMTNTQVTQASNLATVVTQAIVQSPQVVDSPANKSPSPQELEKLADKVIAIVAPSVAPDLPKDTITKITDYVATTVSSSPEIKATPPGVTLTPTQIKSLESDVIKAVSGGTEEQAKGSIQKVEEAQIATPESTTTKTTPFDNVQDFGFEQAAISAGQPFVAPAAPVGPTVPLVINDTGPLATKPIVPMGTQPTGPNITYTASDGTVFIDQISRDRYEQSLSDKERAGKSAFALLESEFSRYGMQSLIEPLRKFIKQGLSQDELIIELRKDPNYQLRFSGNEERIKKGLRALSEAEYIGLEDAYQDIMQRYGLPESYYKKGDLGRQAGFEQLIGFDVSPLQLEERVMLAQNRVKNAPPEVLASLKEFYPDINNGEILAYTLDPKNAIENIKRKVLASEIGAGARQAGLGLGRERAEEFGAFGITGEQSRAGFQQIAGGLERGSQLSAIYQQQPYKQETAETEIFGLAGAPEARKRRQKIIKSEEASFGGQTGLTGGALSRDRAGSF
jgi:hypothetical protein